MKFINRVSLRMRITLLAGTILIFCSIILTITASYNAHSGFISLLPVGTITSTAPASTITKAAPAGTITQAAPAGTIISSSKVTNDLDSGKATAVNAEPLPKNITVSQITLAKRQFDTTSMIILVIVSVLGMVLVYVVAGRSLSPIHNLNKMVSEITEDNLQQRVPDFNKNDEVGMLGHSFNIMLDRLEKSFLRQKRFSANVAHELKTPLAIINAGIQVLHLDGNPAISDYEETLVITERNVKRLMAVVDDLMSLYDEQNELYKGPIDLKDMFKSICSELKPIFEEKNIEIELCCGLQTICGNQVLLYRACFNLVENAVKYNKNGGKISIETKIEDRAGQIVISDTGNGIPKDELQHIFEPFYRVNKSRSRKTGGAGLGLSIVKAIIEKHGWKISADSVLEQGSTFTITLNT